MIVLQVLYTISALLLALVGLNALALAMIYVRRGREASPRLPVVQDQDLPSVVIQLPVYNEQYVVERLVEAIQALDYPSDRLTVQVLDDSTDETIAIAAGAVDRARRAGLQIAHVRRSSREGFKAGALACGFDSSTADFIAVFDADFIPPPDFLRSVIPHFFSDERLGMVQTRWGHLNPGYSPLTTAQSLALDTHFVVEQTARHRGGLLMNFAGTGGVWRRECIADSGGWQADTLSEDIDLSYRAQLGGWRCLYLPEIAVPGEITPLMMAFKRQQARWATGTIQCLRKLGGMVASSQLNVWQKIQAAFHLGGYFIHPLMILMLLTTLPLLLTGNLSQLPLAGLSVAMFGPPLQMLLAQRRLHPRDWPKRLAYFPLLMLIGVGIAVSNTQAVIRAFSGRSHAFERTPKFQLSNRRGTPTPSAYVVPVDWMVGIEIALAIYAGITAALALQSAPALAGFMLLYAGGLGFSAAVSLWQSRSGGNQPSTSGQGWRAYGRKVHSDSASQAG